MTAQFPALVLNADFSPVSYFPLSLISWEDAIHAVCKGRVSVVAEYDKVVRSPSVEMKIPSVIALNQYHPAPKRVAFTRFNVFLRDRFSCQYCGGRFVADDLTFEHVIPRSKGGKTSWENIVAACSPCNTKQDNTQIMKPLRAPREPTPYEMVAAGREFPPNHLHESWVDYLYWDSPIER